MYCWWQPVLFWSQKVNPMTMRIDIKAILIFSAVLRLIWLLLVDVDPISDSGVYDDFALSLVQGKGFAFSDGSLTAFWPVGTSAVYAFFYLIFGHNYIYIALLNWVLGVAIVYLSWSLARHYFNESVALVTACILAVWPLLIQFTTVLASELIFVFMMLTIIWIATQLSKGLLAPALLFGITIGLACHIRPTMAPLLLILPVIALFEHRNVLYCVKYITIALISCALVMTPWSQRNTQLFGERTMLSTNFGPNLWMGNNPNSNGAYMRLPEREFASEKARDNELKQEAIEFIINNPDQYVVLAFKRLGHTFSRETIGVVWNSISLSKLLSDSSLYYLKLISTLYWYIALAMGVVGIVLYIVNYRWAALIFTPIVLIAYFISIPLLTVGQDRYHIPMIPFIACFFAYALVSIRERLGAGKPTSEH